MDSSFDLIPRIKRKAGSVEFPPASLDTVEKAESMLGFQIPEVLRSCYLQIGDGGFGPGYGIIGLDGGYEADFGTLTQTFVVLSMDDPADKQIWPKALLPFNTFGCNIFACADCTDAGARISIYEHDEIFPQDYDLADFFEMWINGVDVLAKGEFEVLSREGRNPVTGEKIVIRARRRLR